MNILKKDIIQLGVLPAVIVGMLAYTFSIKGLISILKSLDVHVQVGSLTALESYGISVGLMMSFAPLIALFLHNKKYGNTAEKQSITNYLLWMVMLIIAGIIGIFINVLSIKFLSNDIKELVPDLHWTSYLEGLQPFSSGLGVMLLFGTILFFVITNKK